MTVLRHYTFHLVSGEAVEVDADPSDVAPDSDYWTFDLLQGREVIVARRHVTHIQVRDING